MPEPAPRLPESGWPVPGTDPRAIREGLPAELLRSEFDAEWGLVMDRAKASMEPGRRGAGGVPDRRGAA